MRRNYRCEPKRTQKGKSHYVADLGIISLQAIFDRLKPLLKTQVVHTTLSEHMQRILESPQRLPGYGHSEEGRETEIGYRQVSGGGVRSEF